MLPSSATAFLSCYCHPPLLLCQVPHWHVFDSLAALEGGGVGASQVATWATALLGSGSMAVEGLCYGNLDEGEAHGGWGRQGGAHGGWG